jgi:hypothetical protein
MQPMGVQEQFYKQLTPIEQAIRSFEEQALESPELAREAFWRLLDNIKHFQTSAMRSLALMVFFALVFELLDLGLISEASIGAIKLAKLETLRFVLPIAIAYKYFTAMSAIRDRNVTANAYVRISDAVYYRLHASGIDSLLSVPSGLVTTIFPFVYVDNRSRRLASTLSTVEHVLAGFLLPIFLSVYAVVQVFRQDGASAWQTWFSCTATALLLIAGLAIPLIQAGAAEDEE